MSKKKKLTLKQEAFVNAYLDMESETYGNATRSYAKAYKKDLKTQRNLASTEGFHNLQKPNIKAAIRKKLDVILSNERVDAELQRIITRSEKDSDRIAAIREYNKLRERFSEKVKVDGNINMKGILSEIQEKDDSIIE